MHETPLTILSSPPTQPLSDIGNFQMTEPSSGDSASNARASMSTDAPKTNCPAARKFAEYLRAAHGANDPTCGTEQRASYSDA
jgi:hypothetical protein